MAERDVSYGNAMGGHPVPPQPGPAPARAPGVPIPRAGVSPGLCSFLRAAPSWTGPPTPSAALSPGMEGRERLILPPSPGAAQDEPGARC